MKKFLLALVTVFGGAGVVLSITAARYQEKVRPNVKVGPVDVGGLTVEDAAKKIRGWWAVEKSKPMELRAAKLKGGLPPMRPSALGFTLDDAASVEGLPMQTFSGDVQSGVMGQEYPVSLLPLRFVPTGVKPVALILKVREAAGAAQPASIKYAKGTIYRSYEKGTVAIDTDALPMAAMNAKAANRPVDVPLVEAPKHVPDEELKKIREVVSEFSTRFSARNANRSENIRVASGKIDGVILMPGESLSFNGTVGRRTVRAGFRLAGVYINGRHDTGIGGGICQVSTTLYNAALFANLPIKRRSNHSLPVPYVPSGRDATVDYGNIDLVFENNYDGPIAIDSEYHPGRLTFRVLGTKPEGLAVKVVQGERRSWAAPVRTVSDPNLLKGRTRIVEGGSGGHSISTYRLVFQNGKLVRREGLGRSSYGGGARVIAVGTKAAPVAPPVVVPPVAPPPIDVPVNEP